MSRPKHKCNANKKRGIHKYTKKDFRMYIALQTREKTQTDEKQKCSYSHHWREVTQLYKL